MDGTIIASIVTGGFGIVYLILQPLITFVKSEKEDGVKTYYCFPRCRCCRYKIPKDDNIYPNILTKCWEPPDNWSPLKHHTNDCEDSDKKSKYIKKTPKDNYLIILPKDEKNGKVETGDKPNVIFFAEFNKKSITNKWFLDADLDYIKNPKYVKVFIRRFYVKDKKWKHLFNNCEYISAKNGINSLEVDSRIGDILEELEIISDEDDNMKKIKKTYECTHEQIGIVVYSKTSRTINHYPCRIYCFNIPKSGKKTIRNLTNLAEKADFGGDVIKQIKEKETSACLIKKVYVGEYPLYVISC